MELNEYRKYKGLSQKKAADSINTFARKHHLCKKDDRVLGISHLSMLERDVRTASLALAGIIFRWSGGAVTYEDQM